MPQYDAYEDPIAPDRPTRPQNSQNASGNNETGNHHLASIVEGDPTSSPHAANNEDGDLYSPAMYHRRHSHLARASQSEMNNVRSVPMPACEKVGSHKTLSDREKAELTEMERSQKEDDEIRMELESDHPMMSDDYQQETYAGSRGSRKDLPVGSWTQSPQKTNLRPKEQHVAVAEKEKPDIPHGWMHRSRASQEMLIERGCAY